MGQDKAVELSAAPEAKDPKKVIAFGFDEEGFFIARIHESYGAAAMLGFMVQMMDLVKAHFLRRQEDRKKNALLRPVNGIINSLRKK